MIITRDDFPRLFNHSNYTIGLELGSYKGEFANTILSNWNGKLICVDLFDRDDNYDLNKNDGFYTKDVEKNKVLPIFNQTIKNHRNNILTIQSDTTSAAKFFPDNYFDFIYIDADHRYESVINDMNAWYSKLKQNCLFAGHDYLPNFDWSKKNNAIFQPYNQSEYVGEFGVNTAVSEFCTKHNIQYNITNEPYWKSWYFFKP